MSELGAIRDAVTAYFDRRPNLPQRAWDSWLPAEHAHAFTVARSAGFDVLDDIRAELRKAIRDGVPFDQFRANLEPILKAKGWWGERKRVDARTGGVITEQLGSPRRLKLIYDANIRSAQAAGEWADIQANKRVLPWLEYVTSLSERKRREHLAWVGTTLPVDDPWWRTHYPPNGWNCKCRVRPRAEPREDLTPAQLRRPPLDPQPWRSRTTGESRLVPRGIDPGWDSNAGLMRERLAGQQLTRRIERMASEEAKREAVRRLMDDPGFRYIRDNGVGFDYERRRDPDMAAIGRIRWPVAVLKPETATAIQARGAIVSLSAADAEKINVKHPEVGDRFWTSLQSIVDAPDLIERDQKAATLWKRDGDMVWKVVLKPTLAGEVFANSVHRGNDETFARKLARSRNNVGE